MVLTNNLFKTEHKNAHFKTFLKYVFKFNLICLYEKKFIIFLLLISFCGGDIEETSEPIETTQSNNEIETTSTTSSTSTSTSTTSTSTSTSTTTTITIPKEIYDKVSSLFFYEQSYLLSYNWEKEFKIVTTDEGCQERTEFFNDRTSNTLSNKAIDNLEKIFSKTINEITSDDILNMSRLTIDDCLVVTLVLDI